MLQTQKECYRTVQSLGEKLYKTNVREERVSYQTFSKIHQKYKINHIFSKDIYLLICSFLLEKNVYCIQNYSITCKENLYIYKFNLKYVRKILEKMRLKKEMEFKEKKRKYKDLFFPSRHFNMVSIISDETFISMIDPKIRTNTEFDLTH
jgi:hypothetical protein